MPWVAEARPHALRLWSPRDADVSEASMRRKDVPLADSDVTAGPSTQQVPQPAQGAHAIKGSQWPKDSDKPKVAHPHPL